MAPVCMGALGLAALLADTGPGGTSVLAETSVSITLDLDGPTEFTVEHVLSGWENTRPTVTYSFRLTSDEFETLTLDCNRNQSEFDGSLGQFLASCRARQRPMLILLEQEDTESWRGSVLIQAHAWSRDLRPDAAIGIIVSEPE